MRISPCSQQGRRRALPLFFPPAAIIGSGRCQYRPRPLPTEKSKPFSRSGVAWSPFVAAFFPSSLLLWGSVRSLSSRKSHLFPRRDAEDAESRREHLSLRERLTLATSTPAISQPLTGQLYGWLPLSCPAGANIPNGYILTSI